MSKLTAILATYVILLLLLSAYILYTSGSIILNPIKVIGVRHGVIADILVSEDKIDIMGYGFNLEYDQAYERLTGSTDVIQKISDHHRLIVEYKFTALFPNNTCKPLPLNKIVLFKNPDTGTYNIITTHHYDATRSPSVFNTLVGIDMSSLSQLIAGWCPNTTGGNVTITVAFKESYIVLDDTHDTRSPPRIAKLLASIPEDILYMRVPFTRDRDGFLLQPDQAEYVTPYKIQWKHTICEGSRCSYQFYLQGRVAYDELTIQYATGDKIGRAVALSFILVLLTIPLLVIVLLKHR